MPQATAKDETVREELKSCEGGFVVLRKLNYGESLKRQQIANVMTIPSTATRNGPREITFNIDFLDLQLFEFSKCIVEHNLEDATGRVLNFNDKKDVASLDGAIAAEIEELVNKVNGVIITEEDKVNFGGQSDGALQKEHQTG